MSLIADALKAAQGEKSRQQGSMQGPAGRVVAAAVLARGAAVDRHGRSARLRMPRSLGIASAAFGVAVLAAVGVVAVAPEPPAPVAIDGDPADASLGVAAAPRVAAEALPDEVAGLPAAPARSGAPLSASTRPSVTGSPRGANLGGAAVPFQVAGSGDAADPSPPPVAAEPAKRTTADAATPTNGRFELTVAPVRPVGRDAFAEALDAHRRRDFAAAVALYRTALERQPGSAEVLNNLGTAYQALGQRAQARDAFRRAITADPGHARAWSNLGVVLGEMGEGMEAQTALAEAVRLDPTNRGAKVNLANQLLNGGLATDARRVLEEVLREDPRLAEAHYALARALEALGDRTSAARHYRTFMETGAGRFPQLEAVVRRRVEQLSGAGGD